MNGIGRKPLVITRWVNVHPNVHPKSPGLSPVTRASGTTGSLVQGLQKFATESGRANSALLPERPLELVWQAAKIKQILGGSYDMLWERNKGTRSAAQTGRASGPEA